MKSNRPCVEVFTDGSVARTNPGKGGWGAVLINGTRIRAAYGKYKEATNNFMEAYAVLQALLLLRVPCQVELYTDSAYVVNGIRAMQNGRLLKTNTQLWRDMWRPLGKHLVVVRHVHGHSTTLYNELADSLAGWGSRDRLEGSFYVHEVVEGSAEDRLLKTVERRITLRKEKAAA